VEENMLPCSHNKKQQAHRGRKVENMTSKQYIELMKNVLEMQKQYIMDGVSDEDRAFDICNGIDIAIEKIEASEFLLDGGIHKE
jgi:hypothetical protein